MRIFPNFHRLFAEKLSFLNSIEDKKWFFGRFERLDTEYDRPFSFITNSSDTDYRSTTRESSPKRPESNPRENNYEKSILFIFFITEKLLSGTDLRRF